MCSSVGALRLVVGWAMVGALLVGFVLRCGVVAHWLPVCLLLVVCVDCVCLWVYLLFTVGLVRYGVWHGGGRYVNSVVFGFLVAVMYTCYCMFAAFCLGVSVAGCLFLIGVCFGVWFGFTVDLLVTVGFARFGDALWLFVVLFIGSVFVFLLDCAYGLWVICVGVCD